MEMPMKIVKMTTVMLMKTMRTTRALGELGPPPAARLQKIGPVFGENLV